MLSFVPARKERERGTSKSSMSVYNNYTDVKIDRQKKVHMHEKVDQHTFLFLSPPSSKCLHLLMGTCFFFLHVVHSILSTIFFVVLAFFLNTGLV